MADIIITKEVSPVVSETWYRNGKQVEKENDSVVVHEEWWTNVDGQPKKYK